MDNLTMVHWVLMSACYYGGVYTLKIHFYGENYTWEVVWCACVYVSPFGAVGRGAGLRLTFWALRGGMVNS